MQYCAGPGLTATTPHVIHATAVVHPRAELDPSVEVGPYAVIDAGVKLGVGCIVGPHAYLTGELTAGDQNHFHKGCAIGDSPQDVKYKNEPTGVRIGNHNVFREHVTVHRSTKVGEWTVIGSNCLLMANAHVGHNSTLSDHAILANGALLGGYASIGERAFISGNCLVHQFCRVGAVAMMQGGAGFSKDLPPFTIGAGINHICGLNAVGLRRAGYGSHDRLELRKAYAALFRSGLILSKAVARAESTFTTGPAKDLIAFIRASTRGVAVEDPMGRRPDDEAEI